MAKSQNDLVGQHPQHPNILGVWLNHTDNPPFANKKHRVLSENTIHRATFINQLADWIIIHHISEKNITRFQEKAKIMSKYDFDKYVDTHKLLPAPDTNTQKGNGTEILLAEYIKSTSKMNLLLHRLRYNSNVDQSMKGDDVILFDLSKRVKKLIVGEAKYRQTPKKYDVLNIVSNLQGSKMIPVSIPFIAKCLEESNPELSEALFELYGELHKNIHDIRHVGFLFGGKLASRTVEHHLNTTNENLVFISLGVDNPHEIIEQAFEIAENKLKSIKK